MTSRLAILGGSPVRSGRYPAGPCIDDDERQGVERVLNSGVLSGFIGAPGPSFLGGEEVRALEGQWREMGGYPHVVAVNSATAALHAGIAALDIPAGLEVVVPPFTMSATVAAVVMAGLTPIFADVDDDLFVITGDTVERAVSDRTAAILVVHLFGQMAPMVPIKALADRLNLVVLEDAAQAPGATQNGYWPGDGTAGAVFSFNQNKVITCGEGGLLATERRDVAIRAQLLRNHLESTVEAFPDVDPVGKVGWNYRLGEVEAAIAQAQTRKLNELIAQRVEMASQLDKILAPITGLQSPRVHPFNSHTYFTYAIRFFREEWGCSREAFVAALHAEGVPCSAGYVSPLYRLPFFGVKDTEDSYGKQFPNCERLARDELVLLPVCGWPASEEDVERVGDAIYKCWDDRAGLRSVQMPPT